MSDREHPEIEDLLEGTAVRPARSVDPRAITRRAKRRTLRVRALGAAGVLAVVAVAGTWIADLGTAPPTEVMLEEGGATGADDEEPDATGDDADADADADAGGDADDADADGDADEADADAEPSGEVTGPERPDEPPEQWVGVRESGDELVITRHEGDEDESVARHPRTTSDEDSAPTQASDVVLDEAGDDVLVALCCEPTSGAVFGVALDGDEELAPLDVQGSRIDMGRDGSLLARTDAFGVLGILPAYPDHEHQIIREDVAAADIAVEPGPDPRVAALVDPEMASMPVHEGQEGRGVLHFWQEDDGGWDALRIDLEEPTCGLVFLAEGRIGLLRPAGELPEDSLDCAGDSLDVLDMETEEIEEAALEFDSSVRHLSVDDSGHYLIATGTDGAVRWATLEGEDGQLADEGYTVADW